MENNLDYILSDGITKDSKLKENIFNEMKKQEKIREEIKVENIPICIECILEDELGNYICGNCRINLCSNHAKEHSNKFPNHKYSYLIKS